MASQGPLSGSTFADDSGTGSVAWTNPGNAAASDNVYATAFVETQTTHYLKCTNFGFAIPAGATILGIVVECEVSGGGATDAAVRLVKAGTIGSTDRSSGVVWTGTDTYLSHGGTTDLWGDTWTAADVNNSGFGAALAAFDAGPITCQVDHVRITVYYTGGAAALDWLPNPNQPHPRPPPLPPRAGWFVPPMEPSGWVNPYSSLLPTWYAQLQTPTPAPVRVRDGWVTAPWDPSNYQFGQWYKPLAEPVRQPRQPAVPFAWVGTAHEWITPALFGLWQQPLSAPARPRPQPLPGWFTFGGDPSRQEFGDLGNWYVPVVQPVRRPPGTTEGRTVAPLEPTQIRPDQALTGWFREAGKPVWVVPPRLGGLFARPADPTLTEAGQAVGWWRPLQAPVRQIPPVAAGWFSLTFQPDALGIVRLDSWFAPLGVPVRRPASEPTPGYPSRLHGLTVEPLEPTQLNPGQAFGWYAPAQTPVRPAARAAAFPFIAEGSVWHQVPSVSSWFVPLATPVRPAPPRHPGFYSYEPPPELWATGVVVAGPFFVAYATYFQAGNIGGKMEET